MSFALYMVGFIVFLGGVIWGAIVAGVPQVYIGIGALVLLGIGPFFRRFGGVVSIDEMLADVPDDLAEIGAMLQLGAAPTLALLRDIDS